MGATLNIHVIYIHFPTDKDRSHDGAGGEGHSAGGCGCPTGPFEWPALEHGPRAQLSAQCRMVLLRRVRGNGQQFPQYLLWECSRGMPLAIASKF